MRLVCLPSESSFFFSTGAATSACVATGDSGFGWVALSGCVAEASPLPDCCVCRSGAEPLCLSGTAVWGRRSAGDRRRDKSSTTLLVAGIARSDRYPILLASLEQ